MCAPAYSPAAPAEFGECISGACVACASLNATGCTATNNCHWDSATARCAFWDNQPCACSGASESVAPDLACADKGYAAMDAYCTSDPRTQVRDRRSAIRPREQRSAFRECIGSVFDLEASFSQVFMCVCRLIITLRVHAGLRVRVHRRADARVPVGALLLDARDRRRRRLPRLRVRLQRLRGLARRLPQRVAHLGGPVRARRR